MNHITIKVIAAAAITLALTAGSSNAATFSYIGSDMRNGTSWQNDDDSTTGTLPGTGDVGTIAMNGTAGGTYSGALAGAVINHTSGTITGTMNMNSPGLIYNLVGGTIDNTNNFNANGMTVNFSSGLLQFSGDLIMNQATGTINLSGSATIQADSGDFDLRINTVGAEFNIASDWTGSLISANDATEADWIAELVYGAVAAGTGSNGVNPASLMSVGDTDITADNFGDFFIVTPDGNGGSSLAFNQAPTFTYIGGDIRNGNSWQNDSDSTTGTLPGTGEVGTIAMNGTAGGTFSGALAGAVINHSSGTITGTMNMNSPGLIYNLVGGTIDNNNNFNANQGSTVNFSSGLLQFSGDLIMNAGGVLNLSGSATIEADSGDFDLRINSVDSEFNVASDWTGRLVSASDATEADWIAELVYGAVAAGTGSDGVIPASSINVGGTDVTADNFGDFFIITPDGNGGSSLALTDVPFPTFELASPFQNRMVLQRGKPVNVWGKADPNAAISVSINGTTVNGLADVSGNWQVELPSQSAGGPHSLIANSGRTTRTITNVLVGDVWFCFGQSNMVRPLSEMTGSSTYIAAIAGNDNIRCLKIDQDAALAEDESAGMNWLPNSSAGTWTSIGSVFAHQLNAATNVPVAIVWAAWGSSSIEGWMPLQLRSQLPYFDEMMNLYQSVSEYQSNATTSSRLPSGFSTNAQGIAGLITNGWSSTNDDIFMRTRPNIIYNKMVHPMRKYGISGFIWYQGEANASNITDCARYGFGLPRLVSEYRERFHQGDLPFLGVQLPSFNRVHWPWFREAQNQLETLNNAHVAVTIDTGSSSNIHPFDKEPIGIRLSLLARKHVLNEDVVAHGPTFDSMSASGSDLTMTFSNATGMNANASARLFQIAGPGANPTFHNADRISVSGNQVTISSTSVTDPREVRYAWIPVPNAQTTLENSSGIPATPFRTDSFALPGLGAQAPQGIDDAYETTQNVTLSVPGNGVLVNDIDLNHDALTATLVTDVNHGTLSLLPDGSFTYTPHNGFAGTDHFTYTCTDGGLISANTTVTLTVTGTPTAYYSWRSSISWKPGDDETKTGDPDLDGIENFLEFALSLDPLVESEDGLPKVSQTDEDFVYYDFNNARAGISYYVLLSTDLITWSDPPFATLTNASTTPVQIPRTEEADGKLFIRLGVSE